MIYTSGMSVKGFGDQDPKNPNCCPALTRVGFVKTKLTCEELAEIRRRIKHFKISHQELADALGKSVPALRNRLQGGKGFNGEDMAVLKRVLHLR